jgi:RimJ/RimL family protein N-acetyltransferase
MAVFVRQATTQDLGALLDVQEDGAVTGLAHIFPQDAYPFPRATLQQRWRDELDDSDTRVYVSVDGGGAVIGFAAIRGNELLHFGTAVRTWGTGTAQALHAVVLEELSRTTRAGCNRLVLRVFEKNIRARRFYVKLGWTETGRRSRSSFPPHAVLIEYQLPLPAPR